MSATEILDVIDGCNNVIGQAKKQDVYRFYLSHRIAHVMVCHADKLFIPRRSLQVNYLPAYYCSSAGGHVRSGESSMQGGLRELREEIGLEGPIEPVTEVFFKHEFPVHISVFIKKFDLNRDRFSLDPAEVHSGGFYSLREIAELDPSLFHPQLPFCISAVADHLKGV